MILTTRRTGKKLIAAQLYLVLFEGLLMSFGIPSVITYFCDVINILLVFLCVKGYKKMFSRIGYSTFIYCLLIYVGILVAGDILNMVSPFLALWAFRNSFRLISFFMSCVVVLTVEDMISMVNKLYRIFVLNFVVVLYQYGILNMSGDYIGGIFGTIVGGNAGVNIFCCLLTIYFVNAYLNGRTTLFRVGSVVVMSLLIAAFAEITVMMVEIPLFIMIAIFISRPSMKTFCIACLSICGLFFGLQLFAELFPGHYKYIQSINAFIEGASGVGGGYNISRLTAVPDITKIFFKNSLIEKMFGYGFGACEYSSLSIFTSKFYESYGYLNYRWFDLQIRFLETGWFGLLGYFSLFLVLLILAVKYKNKLKSNYFSYGIAVSLTILVIISSFYNAVLRTENGYLLFYFLAFFPICLKEIKQQRTIDK